MAELLRCNFYHADIGDSASKAKGKVLTRWIARKRGASLVGISRLGAGLNYLSVRLVIYIDELYSLVAFS